MPKYKDLYKQMVNENKQLFQKFKIVHDAYQRDRNSFKSEFDKLGTEVLKIVSLWEDRLCRAMSKSYGQYCANLTEKFKTLLKRDFPLIDLVGVKIRKKA